LEVVYPNLVVIYVERFYRTISLHDEVSIIAISKIAKILSLIRIKNCLVVTIVGIR